MARPPSIATVDTALAHDLELSLERELGRRLPMNVDGIIAALLCDMEIDPALGKTLFIVSRAAGYAAHAHEQTTAERPFKAPAIEEITYTGPEKRDVPYDRSGSEPVEGDQAKELQ